MSETVAIQNENNPLVNPEKLKIIDQIIADNRHLPGATMVVLN